MYCLTVKPATRLFLGNVRQVKDIEITPQIQIDPITLLLQNPTAEIWDRTILVLYPTIRGETPLFYAYIIIPLLLFLSSPRASNIMIVRVWDSESMMVRGSDKRTVSPRNISMECVPKPQLCTFQ